MKDRRSSLTVFLVMFAGLLILSVASILFGFEPPMDRQEREAMRKAQETWSKSQWMEKEADYKDEDYLNTRGNHRWCGKELQVTIHELDNCHRQLMVK